MLNCRFLRKSVIYFWRNQEKYRFLGKSVIFSEIKKNSLFIFREINKNCRFLGRSVIFCEIKKSNLVF